MKEIKDSAWGEASEGVEVRLWAEKPQWKAGETPTLMLDVANKGAKPIGMHHLAQVHCHVDVDGQWYSWGEPFSIGMPVEQLAGAQTKKPIEVRLSTEWALHPRMKWPVDGLGWPADDSPRLQLAAGKHTVRVSFQPLRMERGVVEPTAVSGPIEIEILPAEAKTVAPKAL